MQQTSSDDSQGSETQSHEVVDELTQLRQLLLGAEYDELLALKEWLNDPEALSIKLSTVISEAIAERFKLDKSLAEVMAPTIEGAIQTSIAEDPHALAESLYPVMGPAIRKSISETLTQMLENMNQLLEQSLSPKSLGWRFDAWRTGRSYSEIVLMNTLEYQVEQVFLIHSETSLLVQHVVADFAITKDPDMVSSMLSAIQDYILDSFSVGEDEALNSMRLGDLTVLIEKGPRAVVAAVVRGKVPSEIEVVLKRAVEEIHMRHGKRLADYSGDPDEYTAIEPTLRSCLLYRRQDQADDEEDKKRNIPWLAIGAIVVLLGMFGYFAYEEREVRDNRERVIANLTRQAGILVVGSQVTDEGLFKISGLRDPLSIEPGVAIAGNVYPLPELLFDFKPYISIEPEIVLIRANHVLKPPGTVQMRLEKSTLYLFGESEVSWLKATVDGFKAIPGIEALDVSELVTFDSLLMEIEAAEALIESVSFHFERAEIEPLNTEITIEQLAAKINLLQQLHESRGGTVVVDIYGEADDTGTEQLNRRIERQRAGYVFDALTDAGVSPDSIRAHSIRETMSEDTRFNDAARFVNPGNTHERKVVLRVTSSLKGTR